ncbi:MAG: ferredoxin--NADP reductase [Deltaproteobacteria bacterium]|nr:ferredoxin--NADP reductase [Deltaproteobacteria bacterium]
MQFHTLRIARVIRETPDASSFVFEIPEAQAELFRYRAGQFLTFRIRRRLRALLRCYSLSSSPEAGDAPMVTVKRVAGGRVSNWLNDRLAEGDHIAALPPAGRFTLREPADGPGEPLLFFAGGSGITPILSLIKTALWRGGRRLRLFYANRDADSVIFRAQLEALARAHAELEVIHHLDSSGGVATPGQLAAAAAGFESAHAYLCGPAPFMELAEAALAAAGFDSGRIFIERFVSPPDGQAPAVALRAEGVACNLAIRLGGTLHRVTCQPGQSILQAAREAGLSPPAACEEGFCGSCAARRLRGEIRLNANDVFSEDDLAAGWTLTCQGYPETPDCEISYDETNS